MEQYLEIIKLNIGACGPNYYAKFYLLIIVACGHYYTSYIGPAAQYLALHNGPTGPLFVFNISGLRPLISCHRDPGPLFFKIRIFISRGLRPLLVRACGPNIRALRPFYVGACGPYMVSCTGPHGPVQQVT